MASPFEAFFRWLSLVVAVPVLALLGAAVLPDGARRASGPGSSTSTCPIAIALGVAFAASAWNTVRGSGPLWFDSLAMLVAALLGARQVQRSAQRAALERADSLRGVAFLEFARRLDGDGPDAPIVEVPLAGARARRPRRGPLRRARPRRRRRPLRPLVARQRRPDRRGRPGPGAGGRRRQRRRDEPRRAARRPRRRRRREDARRRAARHRPGGAVAEAGAAPDDRPPGPALRPGAPGRSPSSPARRGSMRAPRSRSSASSPCSSSPAPARSGSRSRSPCRSR